jgi:dihydroneopterin aldolase
MDKIFLSSLSIECVVGIWEWERRVKQTVIIDLEMAADIRKAASTDRIEDTIDYKKVTKRLLAFVGDSQFHLVETLTERIAELIVTEFGVTWVKVRLNKRGAIRGARDVGIEIERRTEDYPAPSAPHG